MGRTDLNTEVVPRQSHRGVDVGTPLNEGLLPCEKPAYGDAVTELEKSLLETLLELEAAVASMPTANPKPNFLPLFARLDSLTQELPKSTDPTLLHYMHKRSYQKARLHLQGRDAENAAGNCGHV